jgi:hypothetical protein
MPTSLGTFTVGMVVGGAVEVLGRVVATVAGAAMVVDGAAASLAASGAGLRATIPSTSNAAGRSTYQRRPPALRIDPTIRHRPPAFRTQTTPLFGRRRPNEPKGTARFASAAAGVAWIAGFLLFLPR